MDDDPDVADETDYDRLGQELPDGEPMSGSERVEAPARPLTGAERAAINKARFEQMKSARNAAKAEVRRMRPSFWLTTVRILCYG